MSVVQQVAGTSYSEYGMHAIEIATTAGNGVVVFAGWDRNFNPTPAPTPACYVSDSAGNRWYHLSTSDAANSGARCSIWMCPAAVPVSWVSVSLTGFAASLAYRVVELSSMPALCVPDVAVSSSSPSTDSVTIAADGEASVSGIGFCVLTSGSTTAGTPSTPSGWTALTTVSAGGSAVDGVQIWPYWKSSVSAGAVSASWTVTGAAPLAAALATIAASPASPAQPNPDFPVLAVELGIGSLPGDPSAAPPAWVDITARAQGKDSDAWIDTYYGHEYALAAPEAGNTTIGVRNSDGAFTPGNVSSPYWTNALSANPGFETGTTAGWAALSNAALSVQQAYVYDGNWSAEIIPDGSTANPGFTAGQAAVLSRDYCASAWVYLPVAWEPGVYALIGWYSASSVLLATTSGAAVTPVAGTWTQVTVRGSAYPGAAYGIAYFQYNGTPGAGIVSYWDDAGLCPGGQTVQTNTVRDLTPVRVSAYWDGHWYDVAHGYVKSWPQEWPDLPQYGLSKMKAVDGLGVMASCTMPSAVQGEILIDEPYVYLPCGEQYLVNSNGLTGTSDTVQSVTFADAGGLQCTNLSRINQRYGIYKDTGAVQVQTGLALNLLGDQGTAMGATSYSGGQNQGRGPGVLYADPDLPSPGSASLTGVCAECFFIQDDTNAPWLLAAYANGSAFTTALDEPQPDGTSMYVQPLVTYLQVITPGGVITDSSYAISPNPQHVAVVYFAQPSASIPAPFWTAEVWLNGVLGGSVTDIAATDIPPWNAISLGPAAYAFGPSPLVGNYVLGHAAVHSSALSPARIAAHYNIGFYGSVRGLLGDTPQERTAAILCWGYLGLPRGGPRTLNGAQEDLRLGPAYDVGGSSATDALNVVTTSEGGQAACMPSGVLTYLPRWWLYNQPSAVTFGDDSAGGEVPYLRGQGWDFDVTYLYNQTAVTLVTGATTSITATWRDTVSAARHFTRSALTQQIETTSTWDAYDAANWLNAQYNEPVLRVKALTIDAASNPVQAFPAVLATRQGTVATVNRRPVGGAAISTIVQVQKVQHRIASGVWRTGYQMSPYQPQSNVLQLDVAGYDTLGAALALPR